MEQENGKILKNTEEIDNELSIKLIIERLWQNKKMFIRIIPVITIITIFVLYQIPEMYSSSAILLPETEKSKLSGIADIASLAGINIGGSDGSLFKLYPSIIKSEAILKNVIYKNYYSIHKKDSINIIQLNGINKNDPAKEYELTLDKLENNLGVSMDMKTSILTITYDEREPQITADIINQIIVELDNFIRKKRNTSATAQRKFIGTRIEQVISDLTNSEDKLKAFREKNRSILSSPELILEQERLIRDVTINNTIYIELKKQYEIAKIEEVKNIPIINVLDYARPAALKSSPKRGIILATVLVFSFILLFIYSIFKNRLYEMFGIIKNIITPQKK
jgi:uncharacterized protein involved in exopolysaccharide biosynthesis